jgi:hypothetical protein
MTTSDFIATGSLIIAIGAFIYTYLTNTKRYELTSQYRSEIIDWYSDTINTLIALKCEAKNKFPNTELKNELLCKLSANIEIGRFYFPNVQKGNSHGSEKPEAYKGYRNLMLDFLVYSYQIFDGKNPEKFIKHAESLQRHFTSYLFEILDPNSFLKETKKHTNKTFSKDLSFDEYISKDPEAINIYI